MSVQCLKNMSVKMGKGSKRMKVEVPEYITEVRRGKKNLSGVITHGLTRFSSVFFFFLLSFGYLICCCEFILSTLSARSLIHLTKGFCLVYELPSSRGDPQPMKMYSNAW